MSISFDETFFAFVRNENTIKQISSIQEPTNKTIHTILKNKSGLKASYSM